MKKLILFLLISGSLYSQTYVGNTLNDVLEHMKNRDFKLEFVCCKYVLIISIMRDYVYITDFTIDDRHLLLEYLSQISHTSALENISEYSS